MCSPGTVFIWKWEIHRSHLLVCVCIRGHPWIFKNGLEWTRPVSTAAQNFLKINFLSRIHLLSYQYFYPKVWLSPELKKAWKRLGLQLKDEINFQFDFYRMCWWKSRSRLLFPSPAMWDWRRRLRRRCRLCWQLEMRHRQLWQWISIWLRLLP